MAKGGLDLLLSTLAEMETAYLTAEHVWASVPLVMTRKFRNNYYYLRLCTLANN